MLTAIVVAFLASWMTLALLPRTRFARSVLDVPNNRSLHSITVPRIGGIGIAAGIGLGSLATTGLDPVLIWAAAGYLLLFAVSLLDDAWSLPVSVRLVAHLLAAGLWTWALHVPSQWFLLSVLAIVWACNLYNFMDGADGLAGGMAVFGFATLSAASVYADQLALAAVCAGVTAAAVAFLIYNVHPASMFMGDSGSVPLGFLAAAIGLYGTQRDHWPGLLPLLAFFPFVFDATYTLTARVLRGRKPWEAHKEHLYQRLVQRGLGHRKMAELAYVVMAVCQLCALATLRLPFAGQFALLAMVVGLSVLAAGRITRGHRAQA